MERLMLDSNIIIDLLRHRAKALERLQPYGHFQFVISQISYIEVLAGAFKSRKNDTEKFFRSYIVLPLTVRVNLESRKLARRHHVQKPMDLLIAAHAITEKADLLTENFSDFSRYKSDGLILHHYKASGA